MNLYFSKPIQTAGGGNAHPQTTGHPWLHIIHNAWRLAWLLALLSLPWRALAAETTTSLLQKGLFEEEANQNLEAAIQNYQLVISQADEERKLAATAVFRLGECYRKKGLTNEAVAQYQRVLRDYSDQATLAKLSQQNLAGLGLGSITLPNGAAIIGPAEFQQRVLSLLENVQTNVTKQKTRGDLQDLSIKEVDEEAKEIEKLAKIIKDSPDLINGTAGESVPLIKAAENDWMKVALFLLENKADPNATRLGPGFAGDQVMYTALYGAVKRANTEMVKLLLSYHADPNKGDRLPLCWAAEYGNLDIAEQLIKAKADVNNLGDVSGCAPLHLAVKSGHKTMAELLFSRGADLNIKKRVKGNQRNGEEYYSPVHFAVKYNRMSLLEWLCHNKAEVDIKVGAEFTPLLMAINSGKPDAAALLLKYQAEVNPQKVRPNFRGITPLLAAIENGSLPIAELLLKSGADPNGNQKLDREPCRDCFPLNAAIRTKRNEFVTLLLKYKAQASIPGYSPIMTAVESGWTNSLKQLVDAGALMDVKELLNNGPSPHDEINTPITFAIKNEWLNSTIDLLINLGANVVETDGNGESPLHLAVSKGMTNVVSLLAEKANPNFLNAATQTPLDIVLKRINELEKQTPRKEQANSASQPSRPAVRQLVNYPTLPPSDIGQPGIMPVPNVPVSFPIQPLRTQASLSDCQEMARILRAHGAQDEFSRMLFIQAQYANGEPARVFQKDKAGLNRFTLLELLGFCPGFLLRDYPDWMKVTIRRWNSQTKQETTIECPLPKSEAEAAAWKDIVLEWGDIVCISERIYRTGEPRDKGWPNALLAALKAGKREMSLIQQGETNKVIIQLKPQLFGDILTPETPYASLFDRGSQSSPWLISTIYSSGKLLNTSDITRVKVVRKKGGATHEWNYDLSQVKFPDDLWLQDGDEIFIPDREK